MRDASNRVFLFAHMRAAAGGWQALGDRLPALLANTDQLDCAGVFMGLFGLTNQELFVLLSVPADQITANEAHAGVRERLPDDIQLLECLPMRATARPLTDAALTRSGVYVFRFFDVRNADVAEIVSLSNTAWQTFERSEDYRSEPMGLFRSCDNPTDRARMLLLTWYDNMTSWERSRTPHPDATANFRRRAALSSSIIAYATRLANTVAR